MFTIRQLSASLLVLSLALVSASAQTQTNQQEPITKTNIIIERQLVRFTTPSEAVEWHLVVTNQQAEVVFDSGFVYSTALEWPLKNQQDELIQSGLYAYTLTIKAVNDETPRTQRGHLIADRASSSDRVWLTSTQPVGIGADSTTPQVTVSGSPEATVGGAELPGRDGSGYLASGRALSGLSERVGERRDTQGRAVVETDPHAKTQQEALLTPNGSLNRLAKFAADGTSLVDAALFETGGAVGIGTTGPAALLHTKSASAHDLYLENTKDLSIFFRAGVPNTVQLTAGTVSGQSALDISLGTGKGLRMTTTAFPVYGVKDVYFQLNTNSPDLNAFAVIESTNLKGLALSVAEARPLIFGTARTERMRVAANGNVGIGTTAPATPLEVNGLLRSTRNGQPAQYLQLWGGDNSSIRLTAQSTLSAEKPLLIQNLSGEATPGVFNTIHFQVGTTAAPDTKMIIDKDGNVGIGMPAPTSKLYVLNSTPGISAVFAESGSGRGVWGKSTSSIGVFGESTGLEGVFGVSSSAAGVRGASTNNSGVYGESPVASLTAAGVYGKGTGSGSIGVIGESNSNNAVGVFGVTTSTAGVGVYARNLSGGRAMYAEGNVAQNLDNGGMVKAMLEVQSNGTILRCYNGINNTNSGNCGITVTTPLGFGAGVYRIDFGVAIANRFFSVTAQYNGESGNGSYNNGANYRVFNSTSVEVFTFITDNKSDTQPNTFMLIMY